MLVLLMECGIGHLLQGEHCNGLLVMVQLLLYLLILIREVGVLLHLLLQKPGHM